MLTTFIWVGVCCSKVKHKMGNKIIVLLSKGEERGVCMVGNCVIKVVVVLVCGLRSTPLPLPQIQLFYLYPLKIIISRIFQLFEAMLLYICKSVRALVFLKLKPVWYDWRFETLKNTFYKIKFSFSIDKTYKIIYYRIELSFAFMDVVNLVALIK